MSLGICDPTTKAAKLLGMAVDSMVAQSVSNETLIAAFRAIQYIDPQECQTTVHALEERMQYVVKHYPGHPRLPAGWRDDMDPVVASAVQRFLAFHLVTTAGLPYERSPDPKDQMNAEQISEARGTCLEAMLFLLVQGRLPSSILDMRRSDWQTQLAIAWVARVLPLVVDLIERRQDEPPEDIHPMLNVVGPTPTMDRAIRTTLALIREQPSNTRQLTHITSRCWQTFSHIPSPDTWVQHMATIVEQCDALAACLNDQNPTDVYAPVFHLISTYLPAGYCLFG